MKIDNDKIVIEKIPLLEHTGKYRFKRKTDNFIDYVARQKDRTIKEIDYIEWQISYDRKIDDVIRILKDEKDLHILFSESKSEEFLNTLSKNYQNDKKKSERLKDIEKICQKYNEPIILKNRNNKEIRVLLNELSDFTRIMLNKNIIKINELTDLLKYSSDLEDTLDDEYGIEREFIKNNEIRNHGFTLGYDKYPLLTKNINDTFFIEILKKHMQYAIGYQNMIYSH